jgi:hypothetical protein
MLYKYFNDFGKDIVTVRKGSKAAVTKKDTVQKGAAQKGTAKKGTHAKAADVRQVSVDMGKLKEHLSRIIPSHLTIAAAKPIDGSGFSPDGADLIVYREYCKDIIKIMNGYVPCEIIQGTFHVLPFLDRNSLVEVVNRIATVKKIDRFSNIPEEASIVPIPSFVIVFETSYEFTELKNDIINYYMNKSIEHTFEMDIMLIVNKGIVVKNWREKRSFYVLETGLDSMLSFFILMNEYLEMNRGKELDFRNYAKKDVQYKEY